MNKYYVYAYLDPRKPGCYRYADYTFEYEPFYIGKGTKSRILRHLKNEKTNPIKVNKITKIRSEGFEPLTLKLVHNISNEESLEIEKKLIKIIGRFKNGDGPLTNFLEGGESSLGHKASDMFIEKLQKPVIKYDIDGNFIEEYLSVKEAGEKNKIYPQTISQICSGRIKIYKNKFIFLYKGEDFKKRERFRNVYPVIRIDSNLTIKEYKSVTEAAIDNNTSLSRINSVCMGNRFQTQGFIFRYKNHEKIDIFNKKIKERYEKYLLFLDKELLINNIRYKNILYAINIKSMRVNNLLKLIDKKDNML